MEEINNNQENNIEEINNQENRFGDITWTPENSEGMGNLFPSNEKIPYVPKWGQYGEIDWSANEADTFSPLLKPVDKVMKKTTSYHVMLISVILIILGIFYFTSVYEGSFLSFLGLRTEESLAQTAPAVVPPQDTGTQNYVPPPAPAPPAPPAPIPVPAPPVPEIPFTPTATPGQYAQLGSIVPSNPMIQKLPEGAKIQMTFFNRNRGYWEAEKYYIISKASMTEGQISNPDFKFVMNARWVPQFTTTNFCDIMQQAKVAGESDVEAIGSKVSLAWKYKSVIGYRNCIGF